MSGWNDLMHSRFLTAAVIVALLLGVWLRAAPLLGKSLWLDEVYTLQRTGYASVGEVVTHLRGSPFPPAHYVLVHAWRQVCPDPVLGVRGPSFLCGLLAIPCAAVIWRPLIGTRAAAWAAVLTALSAFHVWYSVDAKMYSAVWLLTCLSHGLFLKLLLLPRRPAVAVMAGYLASTALLPLVHFAALSVPAVQGLYLAGALVLRSDRRRQGTLVAGLLSLALLPFVFWIPEMWHAAESGAGLDWIGPARVERFWSDVWQMMGLLLCGFREDNHGELATFSKAMVWLQGWALAATLVGFATVLARTRETAGGTAPNAAVEAGVTRDLLIFLAAGIIVPVLGAFAVSLAGRPVWNVARYLTPVAVSGVIALAVLGRQLRTRWARTLVLGPVLAVNLGMAWLDRTHVTRVPWDVIAARVMETSPDRGATIVCDDAGRWEEAEVTLRELLRLRREQTGRGEAAESDRLVAPEEWSNGDTPPLLLKSRRARRGRPDMLRDRTGAGNRFEQIAAWDVYGTSDVPNPSLVRTVSLWKMETEGGNGR
jgi:hypothetical protein